MASIALADLPLAHRVSLVNTIATPQVALSRQIVSLVTLVQSPPLHQRRAHSAARAHTVRQMEILCTRHAQTALPANHHRLEPHHAQIVMPASTQRLLRHLALLVLRVSIPLWVHPLALTAVSELWPQLDLPRAQHAKPANIALCLAEAFYLLPVISVVRYKRSTTLGFQVTHAAETAFPSAQIASLNRTILMSSARTLNVPHVAQENFLHLEPENALYVHLESTATMEQLSALGADLDQNQERELLHVKIVLSASSLWLVKAVQVHLPAMPAHRVLSLHL